MISPISPESPVSHSRISGLRESVKSANALLADGRTTGHSRTPKKGDQSANVVGRIGPAVIDVPCDRLSQECIRLESEDRWPAAVEVMPGGYRVEVNHATPRQQQLFAIERQLRQLELDRPTWATADRLRAATLREDRQEILQTLKPNNTPKLVYG